MEREGNEYFSLSFHIPFFPIFPWAKMGLDPPIIAEIQRINRKLILKLLGAKSCTYVF